MSVARLPSILADKNPERGGLKSNERVRVSTLGNDSLR